MFQSLLILPKPFEDKASNDNIIDLPSATTAGLHLVLCAICEHSPTHDSNNLAFVSLVQEAFDVADAYDFTNLGDDLARYFRDDTFLGYALAGSSDDQYSACSALERILHLDVLHMFPVIRLILDDDDKISRFLVRLNALRAARVAALQRMEAGFIKDLPMCNGFMDFGKKCLTARGCIGYRRTGGKFSSLRRMAALKANDAIMVTEYGLENKAMEEAVSGAVGCERCSARIIQTFAAGIQDYSISMSRTFSKF